MKLAIGLIIGLLLGFSQNQTKHIYLPYFVQTSWPVGDSLRYAECFNSNNKVVHTDTLNNIHDVDSCAIYTVYDVRGKYGRRDLLKTNRKCLIETYKRLSQVSWLHTVGIQQTVEVEDRGNITMTDTIHVENVNNPGEYIIQIYHFYGFKR